MKLTEQTILYKTCFKTCVKTKHVLKQIWLNGKTACPPLLSTDPAFSFEEIFRKNRGIKIDKKFYPIISNFGFPEEFRQFGSTESELFRKLINLLVTEKFNIIE